MMLANMIVEKSMNKPCKYPWTDVPVDKNIIWMRLFDEHRRDGLYLTAACPVCNKKTLHQYYTVGRYENTESRGVRYIGTGSLWEWCSSCYCYAHYSALVPSFWQDKLEVDEAKLTPLPELLEIARIKQQE